MDSEKIEILKRLIFDVLKEMCFLFQSDSLSSVQSKEEPILIRINCGSRYNVFLKFDAILARTIARNYLGSSDREVEDSLLHSALTEVVNMVGGNFMNEIEMEPSDHLSIPEIVEEDWRIFGHDPQIRVVSEAIRINQRPVQLTIAEHLT